MTRTLIKDAEILVTMDDDLGEIANGSILIENDKIARIENNIPSTNIDEIINAKGCVVTPGLVNTHHHLFQTLTRAVPQSQDALLFDWLKTLYPIWARMTPEDVFCATQVGLAELALSGCTMSSDHLYLFPNSIKLHDTIEAARSIGIRFHPTRGAMSVGESDGGLPPDSLVEDEREILKSFVDVVDEFHDPAEGSMLRVGLAPCSPFSVSTDLMRDAAILADEKQVMLHTHLAENTEDIAYSLATFGCRPGQYVEDLGWLGNHVWHAHCVKLDQAEIDLFARTKTGVAHCPCSNCRLGSGIAPVKAMLDAGVPVGLGVDGSASNDSAHLLSEARQMMLLQRVNLGADALSARQALKTATLGGAQVLNRPECGRLAVGLQADIAIWDTTSLAASGAWDLVAALVLCGPFNVRDLLVAGKRIVKDTHLTNLDMNDLAMRAKQAVDKLVGA